MSYSLQINYKPTEQNVNADGLSRLPKEDESFLDADTLEATDVQDQLLANLPVDSSVVAKHTTIDPALER